MTLSDQQVLVTGATGFLGGALVLRLAVEGARVRALARSARKAEFLRERGIEVFEGDVTDRTAMREAAQGCHVVFHVAASLGGSYAQQRAVNVEGTRNVALAAALANVERFVHVSSISAYGYNYRGDVTEEMALAPGADPYAITKAEAEHVVREIDMPYTMIRPGMIYGPGAVNWTGNLFKVARLNPTPFVGNGLGSAFAIHVDDVVDLLVTSATHPAAVGQVFNCTPDPSPTWREYLGRYSLLAGHDNWLAIPPALIYPIAGIAMLLSATLHDGARLARSGRLSDARNHLQDGESARSAGLDAANRPRHGDRQLRSLAA